MSNRYDLVYNTYMGPQAARFANDSKLYNLPTYKKRYVVYPYDTKKYREIWERLKNAAIKLKDRSIFDRVNPYRILEHCYIKENGEKKYLGDEHHIYRYASLQKIYSLIADEIFCYQMKLNLGEWRIIKDGVVIYLNPDGNQAEIDGTQNIPIQERFKIHIRVLRLLRQGVKLKKAVKIARKKTK